MWCIAIKSIQNGNDDPFSVLKQATISLLILIRQRLDAPAHAHSFHMSLHRSHTHKMSVDKGSGQN